MKRNLRYLALQDTDGDGNLDKQLIWVDQEQLYYFERDERFNGEDVDADGVSNEQDAFLLILQSLLIRTVTVSATTEMYS